MKPPYLVAFTMIAVTTIGCSNSSSSAPPSTAAALPPTTSTTISPSSQAGAEAGLGPSDSQAPNVEGDDAAAKAAVVARYDQLSDAAHACLGEPEACDVPSVLSDYADPDASLSRYYERRWRGLIEKDWTVQNLDQSERWPNSVHVEADYAVLVGCVIDRGVVVDQSGDVVHDETSYREEETVWNLVDDQWRLVGGQTYGIGSTSSSICDF